MPALFFPLVPAPRRASFFRRAGLRISPWLGLLLATGLLLNPAIAQAEKGSGGKG